MRQAVVCERMKRPHTRASCERVRVSFSLPHVFPTGRAQHPKGDGVLSRRSQTALLCSCCVGRDATNTGRDTGDTESVGSARKERPCAREEPSE